MIPFLILLPVLVTYAMLSFFAIFHLSHFGLERERRFYYKIITIFLTVSVILFILLAIFLFLTSWDRFNFFDHESNEDF